MYKVVVTDVLKPVIPEEPILKAAGATLVYADARNVAELIAATRDADGIIVYLAPITAKIINALERCQIIVRRGIGYDNVDIKAAATKGIPVANVPDYCSDEVADHTMALLLSAARKVVAASRQILVGGWDYRKLLPIPALRGSILGLIGFGKIARAVAERAKCFGMEIIVSDPFISTEVAARYSVELVSLKEVLKSADFISVHAPLTPETAGMLSKREFGMMRPTAVIINAARGRVIDEPALIEALRDKKIAGAALDVTAEEPPPAESPLRKMDNVILTPHVAWYSERSVRVLGEKVAQEIIRVFSGELPKSLVNPEVIRVRTDLRPSG